MIPKKHDIVFLHIVLEFLLLNLSILTVYILKLDNLAIATLNDIFTLDLIYLGVIFNLVWWLIVLINRDQEFYMYYGLQNRIKFFVISTFLFLGITSSMAILFKMEYFNRTTFLLPIFIFSILDFIALSMMLEFLKTKKSSTYQSNILLIGVNERVGHVSNFTDKIQEAGYEVLGYLDDNHTAPIKDGIESFGKVNELANILDERPIDEIFIMGSSLSSEEIEKIIMVADYQGVRINLIPEAPLFGGSTFKPFNLNGVPVFQHRQTPLDLLNNFLLKRAFDILFSLTVIIILFPVFLLIGILIYMDGKGGIIYAPLRKGESGRPFRCYKFRTMKVNDNPINGTRSTVKNDPRLTKVGKYLRKFDLDELPQFFNVLKGDMSVVGPRPHRVNLQHDFRAIVNDYMVRHYVKPGVSGWAQVNGWRGPTTSDKQKKERIKHDLWYIENWNFWLDLKIIFLTVFGKKVRINAF